MRLGISSWTYPWAVGVVGHAPAQPLTPVELVARAESLGVSVLQLADNLPLHTLAPEDVAALAAAARSAGVTLELGLRGLTVAHVQRYLDLCQAVGARLLRAVIDSPGDEPSPDEIVARLHALRPALAAAEVTLAIENHDRFTARTLADIVCRADSPAVGVCLDTVNSFGELVGPSVVVDTLAPYVVNLHLKDFTVSRAPHGMRMIIEGRPLGQGRLDVRWLLETLAANDAAQHGNLSAIIELWPPDQGAVAANIALEARWAAESVAAARRWLAD
ncbi:MAG: TIM barrel protein [Anaerolineales bacterium]